MDPKIKESQISVQLELKKREKHDGKLIGVVENGNHSHGNHILSTIIDYSLKNNEGVCFVALLHPQSHYNYIGMKIGFNLKSCIEKEQVKFIDNLKASQEKLLDSNSVQTGDVLLQWLCRQVEENVKTLHKNYDRVALIVDDISVLLGLNCSVKQVQCFLQWLLASIFIENGGKRSSLAVLAHVETEDEESKRLAASVKHASQFFANVAPLRTVVINRG
ncbi:elongator complex protein 6-like [Neocloeon triangulifer]|uniref:elongator complex protein 6-like n=1 Tax=Neocloeon triangulifer TaxID=2078957 RepID=UPI00286F6C6F|nr:elongator complex protein 6-like [Neocloeon triangulifer]